MGAGAGGDPHGCLERHAGTVEDRLPVCKLGEEKSSEDADAALAGRRRQVGVRPASIQVENTGWKSRG